MSPSFFFFPSHVDSLFDLLLTTLKIHKSIKMTSVALTAVGIQGAFATVAGLKMSYLRIAARWLGKMHPDFEDFHALQLNMAEYHPLLMVLYAVLHFKAQAESRALTKEERRAILCGLISSPLFWLAGMHIGVRGKFNPVRAIAAGLRYLSVAWMSYLVAKA